MQKQKAVIFGMGSGYKKREQSLKEKYNIVAYSDNYGTNDRYIPYISPANLDKIEYDIIVICSIPYYLSIKYQLIQNYHIKEKSIKGIEDVPIYIGKDVESTIFSHIAQYRQLNKRKAFNIKEENMWLIGSDYCASAGKPKEHYFAQDIWAAKKILKDSPSKHYDVGSRLDGFLSHLLVFCENVNYIDIRPLPYEIPGLNFIQGDATNLENVEDESISSLSSLHAVEHFGLGRYGDPIDPEACFKAMKAFQRVLKKGSRLYFGVPIGSQDSVEFNAHRIFHPLTILENFNQMELLEFSYVKDCTVVKVPNNEITIVSKSIPNNTCGLFEFVKRI